MKTKSAPDRGNTAGSRASAPFSATDAPGVIPAANAASFGAAAPVPPFLSRVDLVAREAALCANLRRLFTFSAHSFYFPHPDLYTSTLPEPSYIEEEKKLLLPLRQDGGEFLGFFVARGVPASQVAGMLPLLPGAAGLCLDNLALGRQSIMDRVTGLHNREAMFEAMARGIDQLQTLLAPDRALTADDGNGSRFSAGGQFSLLLIRLNGLAAIVRDYGYMQADALLSLLGQKLADEQPRHAFAARSGDYELAVLLPSFSLQACREFSLKARAALLDVFVRNSLTGRKLRVAPSIGYINCPRDFAGLERRSSAEQARHLLRRARLAAALAAANLTPPVLSGQAGKLGAVFDNREAEPQPVMAYADILREGGRVLEQRPLSRLLVSLGYSAGARVGQSFTVWGYAVPAAIEGSAPPVISRRYKADIYLVEVGANEAVAEIMHTDDTQFPPEAGDYLRLGVSSLNRGSKTAFYPDDAPQDVTRPEPENIGAATAAAHSTDDAAIFQGYADFLPRWSRERERHERFALVLGRFGLRFAEDKDAPSGTSQNEPDANQQSLLDDDAALPQGEAWPCENGKNSDPGSRWESLMLSIASKCREYFGKNLLLGRYALNSLICFVPDPDIAQLSARLERLSADLSGALGIGAAFGIAPHPFLDFNKADCLENAKKALDYAILLPPPHVGALDSLALNISADRLCSLGDRLGAIAEYRQALLCDPGNILAWNSLGVVLAGLGRQQEARQSLEEALERAPNDLNTLYNLGNLHQHLGNLDESRRFYRRCQELEPENVFTLYRLGQLAEREGYIAEAERLYRQALNMPGGAALTRRSLARLAIKKGEFSQAREELHEALLLNPHDAIALHLLAGLYLDAGEDPVVAESLARQSAALRPDLRQAWLELARALEANGKKADAREALIKAGEL